MGRAKQPVSINGIEFDALIEEERVFEATVPEYAVESGFTISDAIILGAEKLSMVLYVTNTPVTWNARHKGSSDRVNDVIRQMEDLYFQAKPVTIITTDNTFENMAIESMSIKKTVETGYAREIPISFKNIPVSKTRTTHIPDSYGKSGATGASAGTANTTTGTVPGTEEPGVDTAVEEDDYQASVLTGLSDYASRAWEHAKNFFGGSK